jgi:hypothetical protein
MAYRPDPDPAVTVRELPRHPHDHPVWEISVAGEVVGWVRRHNIRGCSTDFFNAEAIHPENGKKYNLENSIDLADRVAKIVNFHRDPMTSEQHLGLPPWR